MHVFEVWSLESVVSVGSEISIQDLFIFSKQRSRQEWGVSGSLNRAGNILLEIDAYWPVYATPCPQWYNEITYNPICATVGTLCTHNRGG